MQIRYSPWSAIAVLLAAFTATAQTTKQVIEAPVVKSQLRVRVDAKSLKWALDEEETYRAFPPDSFFLTKRSIYVTVHELNPLRQQATASAKPIDDPSAAILTKLLEAIGSVASTVAPVAASSAVRAAGGQLALLGTVPLPQPCNLRSSAVNNVGGLYDLLYGPGASASTVEVNINKWRKDIDEAFSRKLGGPSAMRQAASSIQSFAGEIKTTIEKAKQLSDHIQLCAGDKWTGPAIPNDEKQLYLAASLTTATTNARLKELESMRQNLLELATALTDQYASDAKWMGEHKADFQISDEIAPNSEKMQVVTAKVAAVPLKVDPTSGVVSLAQQESATASFTVKRYSALTPEVGVGAVFGKLRQPKYGTGTNEKGETVVKRVPDTSLSINPSLMVNFVCRCSAGPLAPMLQMGASTSKDLPALLLGGGLRLFGVGKGDVAIGGGVMFGWVKDLQKLSEGSVITGTKDIEADLGYAGKPKTGSYFVIQYKF